MTKQPSNECSHFEQPTNKPFMKRKQLIEQRKVETKWDQLEIEHNTSKKFDNLILVNLASNKLLRIIGIPMWGLGLSHIPPFHGLKWMMILSK